MLDNLTHYCPPNPSFWQGRSDSLPNERFFQKVHCLNLLEEKIENLQDKHTIIIGFASDEGIRRNLGRIGAHHGPNAIKEQLAKLSAHTPQKFIDAGNIVVTAKELENAQKELAKIIVHCHQLGHSTIALGGGHEIAWGHYLGLSNKYPQIGILNFDAHFDLRPVKQESTSGTPFWQMSEHCKKNKIAFNYCCIGIQPTANTKSLFEYAQRNEVHYLTAEQIHQENVNWQIAYLENFISKVDAIYLTICLDVFAEGFAPGVSAPQALGLNPWQVFNLLKYIQQTGKVVGLDIAELSPPLDENGKTARLAADILGNYLNLGLA